MCNTEYRGEYSTYRSSMSSIGNAPGTTLGTTVGIILIQTVQYVRERRNNEAGSSVVCMSIWCRIMMCGTD